MSNLALCASTGELPVDLVALREEVLAAGGAVGNDVLRRLLARGPSWAMAGVLDAIDSDLVFPVECDLPDPEAVTEHAMQVAATVEKAGSLDSVSVHDHLECLRDLRDGPHWSGDFPV